LQVNELLRSDGAILLGDNPIKDGQIDIVKPSRKLRCRCWPRNSDLRSRGYGKAGFVLYTVLIRGKSHHRRLSPIMGHAVNRRAKSNALLSKGMENYTKGYCARANAGARVFLEFA
jgi:hypothetical protein